MIQALIFLFLMAGCTEFPLPEDEVEIPELSIGPTEAFFVAPDGNDKNPGTLEEPWATWEKAFNYPLIKPGDTVFFRGGVYSPLKTGGGYGINSTISGRPGQYVHYLNFPNEVPIMDCSTIKTKSTLNYPLYMSKIEYVHIKGLTVRNVWQLDGEDEVQAWNIVSSNNIIFENCVVYNTHGRGFKSDRCDELYYINCDSYNHCDSLTTVPSHNPMPGNDGTGFVDFNWTSSQTSVYYINCRAWNCGDQGFSSGSIGYTEYDGCWSFNNGQLEGGGHGFKMGWITEPVPDKVNRLYKNCLAAYNRQYGFNTNDQGYKCGGLHVFNNTSYHNGYHEDWSRLTAGFYVYNTNDSDEREYSRVYKNNIGFSNEDSDIITGKGAVYTHEHNSWDSPPGVSLSSKIFLSTDSTGLSGPRQEDGSLPDLDFLKLAPNSVVIDAGTKSTGLTYKGNAPDLGAFEYGAK